jgi:hypothetical protein
MLLQLNNIYKWVNQGGKRIFLLLNDLSLKCGEFISSWVHQVLEIDCNGMLSDAG